MAHPEIAVVSTIQDILDFGGAKGGKIRHSCLCAVAKKS
jgi:hypothetical protein